MILHGRESERSIKPAPTEELDELMKDQIAVAKASCGLMRIHMPEFRDRSADVPNQAWAAGQLATVGLEQLTDMAEHESAQTLARVTAESENSEAVAEPLNTENFNSDVQPAKEASMFEAQEDIEPGRQFLYSEPIINSGWLWQAFESSDDEAQV